MKRIWVRTKDHPAALGRNMKCGEKVWNLDFETDNGTAMRIHVGPEARLAFIEMLKEDAALVADAWPHET